VLFKELSVAHFVHVSAYCASIRCAPFASIAFGLGLARKVGCLALLVEGFALWVFQRSCQSAQLDQVGLSGFGAISAPLKLSRPSAWWTPNGVLGVVVWNNKVFIGVPISTLLFLCLSSFVHCSVHGGLAIKNPF
jgi:hypothetical protein